MFSELRTIETIYEFSKTVSVTKVNFFVIFVYFVLNKYFYMSLEPMV